MGGREANMLSMRREGLCPWVVRVLRRSKESGGVGSSRSGSAAGNSCSSTKDKSSESGGWSSSEVGTTAPSGTVKEQVHQSHSLPLELRLEQRQEGERIEEERPEKVDEVDDDE